MTIKVDLMAAMRDIAEAADHLDQVYDCMFAGGKEVDTTLLLEQAVTLVTGAVKLIEKIEAGLEENDSGDVDEDH